MQYTKPSFTLPASNYRIAQWKWDYAILSREKFVAKYGEEAWKTLSQPSTSETTAITNG